MIVLETGLNGDFEGLNGFNIRKSLKRINIKDVSLKNASKVAQASAMLGVGVPPGVVAKRLGLNGDFEGLNGGLKIAKALKKVNLKGAIKVVKAVAPLALSIIPVAGGALGGIASKLLTNKDGSANLVGRTVDNIQEIAKTDTGQAVLNIATPLVKTAKISLLQEKGEIPNDAQVETIAAQKGTTPQQELDAIAAKTTPTAQTVVTPNAPAKKDNTMLIVGGVATLGIAYMIFK